MISVIIAAAGLGTRMGGSVKKQYRLIGNLTVLERTVKAFCALNECLQIIVAAGKDDLDFTKNLLKSYDKVKVVEGGATRSESVSKALEHVNEKLVLVHDAARCFVDEKTIDNVVCALKNGEQAVIPCVQPKNTIRTAENTLDRSKLFEVQTPQGFYADTLRKAFAKAKADSFTPTDEGALMDRLGIKVCIVEGNYSNIKITTEDDMKQLSVRVGQGYDVHRMTEGRRLMLGCVEVPCNRGLLGHSDADVLSHAIADALLGAAGLRDIGYYFPDNSAETEGMAGKEILGRTAKLVRDAGFEIVNIDSTIAAQVPKLAPFIGDMKLEVAKALGINPSQVGIKATTEEGLGITGNGDAMAAQAVASIQ